MKGVLCVIEYHSAVKRHEVLVHPTVWMHLAISCQVKKEVTKGHILCDPFTRSVQDRRIHGARKRSVVGWGGHGNDWKEHRVSYVDNGNV